MVDRLGDIDFRKKPVKPQLFLCKPSKEIIGKLNEAYDIKFNLKLGALDQLSFRLPVFIDKNHAIERNENADNIKGRYLVKLVLDKYEEYFVVNTLTKQGEDSGEYLDIDMLSLGYELNDKTIRGYEVVSKKLTELTNDILVDTIWKVGYVDSEFDLKYRGLQVSSNTALELVFEVAKTFNALTIWHTQTRTIDFVKPDNTGLDKGFRIKYGRYLETLNEEDNAEEIITRLKLYGKDDISIRGINPTGTSYIEDFTYFIYPYSETISGDTYEVLSHSDYMSDELCHAILAYENLLEDNKTVFQDLLAEKGTYNDTLDVMNNDLIELQAELKILLDERDVLNTRISKQQDAIDNADNHGESTTLLKSDLVSMQAELNIKLFDINAKQGEVDNQKSLIVTQEDKVTGVENEIDDLKQLLDVRNNFTPALLEERNQYIIEKEWSDSNIETAEDLLKEGVKAFNELKQQKVTLKVDVANFLSMVTEQRNWDKLSLGDAITIEHERLNIAFKAKLMEIEYSFEDDKINLTITNVKDLSNKDKFLDMLYKSYNSSTQVSIDSWKWDLSMENKGAINQIINNIWDANKQAIIGAKDQVVEISDRGLIIRDPNDPLTYLVGLNGMIAITNDGGQTWKHAITGTGIVGERIYGKVIMGVNLAIEDEHGIVKWQGSLGEIFDRNGKLVMKMGLVAENPDTFGLWSFNDITRVRMDDKTGFVIEKANLAETDGWEKLLWADQSDGTLYTHNLVAENIKIVNDVGKTILDAEIDYIDIGAFQTIVMDNKLTSLEKMQLITELYKIYSGYKKTVEQAEEYIRSQRDDILDTTSQFLEKTPSTIDLYSTKPLTDAYNALLDYMANYIKVVAKDPLDITVDDPMTEQTSDIPDRSVFILKFKDYYDEESKLKNAIEDSMYYSSMNMGTFYNNIVIGTHGFIALRSDGKYRAFLNATNGLALQKWENNQWKNKVYASIGNSTYEDGTLIAEDLVAKRLRIETSNGGVLLDVRSLSIDFTVLDRIILDNVIMSPEKIVLLNQYKSITKQYISLKDEITKYANTIYNDRDSVYAGLTTAKDLLVSAGADLDAKYNALTTYLTPVFADMNAKTNIVDDLLSTRTEFHLKWEDFYKAYEVARNSLGDFLEKSSLQLGRNYNNTVIDALNGIVVTRGNMMNRTTLNATEGIMIEQNVGNAGSPTWVKRFYVDLNGYLFAEELRTKKLRILDGTIGDAIILDALTGITINGQHGEQIRLNANEGIAIDVNGDPRFWIHTDGTLRAKRLIVSEDDVDPLELPDGSYISKLTVSSVRTLNSVSPQDYVFVKDNYIKWYSGNGSATDVEKMSINIAEAGNEYAGFPVIKMGSGDPQGNEVGRIIKDNQGFKLEFHQNNVGGVGNLRRIWMTPTGTDGIIIESVGTAVKVLSDNKIRLEVNSSNYLEITPSGIKLVGTRIDMN